MYNNCYNLCFSGPQIDWDPEISEALDRMENDSDCDASLDDDFVLQVKKVKNNEF